MRPKPTRASAAQSRALRISRAPAFSPRGRRLAIAQSMAQSVESAAANAEDAKREWLAAAIEDGCEIPEPQDEYSGQFKLRIPKSLHRDLALHARREGISMNQYCLYLLAKNDAEQNRVTSA